MRTPWLLGAALLASACSVPLSGAPCDSDLNCPNGQSCVSGTCQEGSAPLPGPDAGPACVSDPECAGTEATACDASGMLATCEEVQAGCRKLVSPVACAAGKVCRDGACHCSSGCDKGATACSTGGQLQVCQVEGAAECGTLVDTACATGLTCSAASGTAKCACPAPDPSDSLYVDPASSDSALEPTGALQPAACRFARLGDALAHASPGTLVTLLGSGTLDQESFPMAIPTDVRVMAEACLAAECDPATWVIPVGASTSAGAAVTLANGASLAGVNLKDAGSTASTFLSCDDGSVILQDVALAGSADGTAKAASGLSVTGACSATLQRVRASLFTGAAVSLDGAEATAFIVGGSFVSSGVGLQVLGGDATAAPSDELDEATRPTFSQNAVGIAVGAPGATEAATLAATRPLLSGNGTGLTLAGSAASVATLSGAALSDCTGTGIAASGGTLTVSGGTITGGETGLSLAGADVQLQDGAVVTLAAGNGIEILGSAPDVVLAGVRVTDNGAAGVKLAGGVLGLYGSEIDGNVNDGVRAEGGTLDVSDSSLHGNKAWGLSLAGATAQISGSEIWDNGNANDGGGLGVIGAGATLAVFSGNRLHGNRRAQAYFGRAPAAGGAWALSAATCYGAINHLYCYASGAVGLLVDSGLDPVVASNVSWANAAPAAGVDYQGPATVGTACSATACP